MSSNGSGEDASQLQESILSEKTLVQANQSTLDSAAPTTIHIPRQEPPDLANLRSLLKFPVLPVRPISASQEERTKYVALTEGVLFEGKCTKLEELVYKQVVEGVGRLLRGMHKKRPELAPADKVLELKNFLQDMYLKHVQQCVASFREEVCSLMTVDIGDAEDGAQSAADEEVLRSFLEDLKRVGDMAEEGAQVQAHNAALDILLAELDMELEATHRLEDTMHRTLDGISVPSEEEMAGAARALRQCGEIASCITQLGRKPASSL